tara:strand:- start:1621 stop:3255 length:1635 start_codon:yes stop_codon:yes gene_type:complete
MANGFRSQQINRSSFSDLLQLIQGSAEAGRRRQAEYADIYRDFDKNITNTYDNEQLVQKKQQFDNYFNSNRGSMNESMLAKYELLDAKFKQQQSDNDAYTFGINKNREIAKEVENALLSYSAINEDAELTSDQKITKRKEAMDVLGASIGDYLSDAGEFRTKHYNRLARSPQDAFYIDSLNELFAFGIAQAEDDFVLDSNEARAFSLALQTQSFEPIKAYKVNEMNLNSLLNQKQVQQTDLLYKQYEISTDISNKVNYYYELEEMAANEKGEYSSEEQQNAKDNLLSLENQSFYTDDEGNKYMYANLSDDESEESLFAAQQILGRLQTFEQLENINTIYSKRVGQSYLQSINQAPLIKDEINTIFGIAKPVVEDEDDDKTVIQPKVDTDKDDEVISENQITENKLAATQDKETKGNFIEIDYSDKANVQTVKGGVYLNINNTKKFVKNSQLSEYQNPTIKNEQDFFNELMDKKNQPDFKKGFPEGSSIEVFLSLYNPKIKKKLKTKVYAMWSSLAQGKNERANEIGQQIQQIIKNSKVNYPKQN